MTALDLLEHTPYWEMRLTPAGERVAIEIPTHDPHGDRSRTRA